MDNARFSKAFFVSLASLAIASIALLPAQSIPQVKVPNAKGPDFNKDIQPLLREKCMPCHGDVQAAGGLKLTKLKLAMTGGNSGSRGLVPHDPNASGVVQRVSTTNVDLLMPPKRSGKTPLTPAHVMLCTVGIRIMDCVQPVTRPALTVPRARKQAINDTLIRSRFFVTNKSFDLSIRWRQTDEVKCHTADERCSVGCRPH